MRILIADGDGARSKGLFEALAERGHEIDRASHGPAALELALERSPDVIVCPSDLPVIDGARLAEILRGNPRTKEVSFVFLVEDELDAPISLHVRDRIVASPWRESTVLAHVEGNRALEFRDEPGPEVEIEGKLSQLSLVDLLQMFHLGRKTGKLEVVLDGVASPALIQIEAGQIVDASLEIPGGDRIHGEKALFRLMAARRGRFAFSRGSAEGDPAIERPTRELLIEAARQLDEWLQLRGRLPQRGTRLVQRVPGQRFSGGTHPVVREVLEAVAAHGEIGEILDRCAVSDAQVARVLVRLLQHRVLEVESAEADTSGSQPGDQLIFTQAQRRRLRDWACARGEAPAIVRVLAVPADAQALKDFLDVLRDQPDFHVDPASRSASPGLQLCKLGHFALGEDLWLRIVVLPPGDSCQPVWEVAAHGMLGALLLLRTPVAPALQAVERVCAALRRASGSPIVQVVETSAAAPTLGEAERNELERVGDGPLFALPTEPDPERLAVLQNLFARLVP